MSTPVPFSLEVPDDDIADLKARLALTRFPEQPPGEPWAYGASLEYMRELVPQDFPAVGIENAQHHVFLDQPLAFVDALREMVKNLG